jgi:penicillin-binding protein 1A
MKIYTTIDFETQKIAEQALLAAMKDNQSRFLAEWGNTDPWSNEFFISKVKQTPEYLSLLKEYPDDDKKIWNELRKPRSTTIFTYNGEKDTVISVINEVRHYTRMLRGAMVAVDHSN